MPPRCPATYDVSPAFHGLPQMEALIVNVLARCITDAAIRATNAPRPRPTTSSRFTTPARAPRQRRRSNASFTRRARHSSPSIFTLRTTIAWVAIITITPPSLLQRLRHQTPCSPPWWGGLHFRRLPLVEFLLLSILSALGLTARSNRPETEFFTERRRRLDSKLLTTPPTCHSA